MHMQKRSSSKGRKVGLSDSALLGTLTLQEKSQDGLSDEVRHLIAVALGRQGGLKGGKARAKKLSPQTRSAIAKKAAEARWASRKK